MGRTSNLKILETLDELRAFLKFQSNNKNRDRIRALIYLKEDTFANRRLLIKHLGISMRTLERWISGYIKGGMKELLLPEKRIRKPYLISDEVNAGLKQRVENSETGFASYVEAQRWVASEYGIELKYNTIREHLIRYYKTKIKSLRKSHIKKDDKAVEAFLKTT